MSRERERKGGREGERKRGREGERERERERERVCERVRVCVCERENCLNKKYKVFHKILFHALNKNGFFKINLLYNIMRNYIKISKL